MICTYYGLKLPITKIRDLIKVDYQGANVYGIVTGASEIGFNTDALEGTPNELLDGLKNGEIPFPFIARIINEDNYEHFIVIYDLRDNYFIIGDPAKSKNTKISFDTFFRHWLGQIMTFVPNEHFSKGNEIKGSFKKFFKFITNQKKMLLFVFIVSLIVSFINISGSVIFQFVLSDITEQTAFMDESGIEEVEEEHDHEGESKFEQALEQFEDKLSAVFANLKTVCITVILLYVFRILLQVLRGYLLAMTAKKVDVSITMNYYNHLTELPINFYGTRKTGEFMSRFNDVDKIRDAVSATTLTIMLDTIMAIACGALLFYISSTLFLITLTVVVIYAFIMLVFRNPIKSINHSLMESEAQVTSFLKESIDGIETIRANQYKDRAQFKIKNLYDKFTEKNVKGSVIYTIQESLVSASAAIGVVILLWVGTHLCINNTISISDLFIFYYLISYFIDPVKNLINLQPELQTAIVAAERLNDILDADIENNQKQEINSIIDDIKVDNIDFRYGNRELVLENVTMEFKIGTKTAIIGETGCGKTTLVKLLMAFDKPESGSITTGKNDIYQYSPDSIRKRISYISQDIFLFSDSIYNNLRMGNEDIANEDIEKICQQCGIDDFICTLPMGYDTVLEENGNNLSGGQKQRLAIARALLRKPDVLIMDEATSNLDTVTENSIKAMIDNFSENMTCIIIAHRLNTIKNCDYIYVMDKGQVAEEGTHEELLKRNGLYSKYVNQ